MKIKTSCEKLGFRHQLKKSMNNNWSVLSQLITTRTSKTPLIPEWDQKAVFSKLCAAAVH